ncbi:MAG: VWA domain-containing protein [Acidobacteriota bacterium]
MKRPKILLPLLLIAVSLFAGSAPTTASEAELWSDSQREFFLGGPALLLGAEKRERLVTMDPEAREQEMLTFLSRDPDPSTSLNELAEGIERRRQLVRAEFLSPRDIRSELLFLNGPPLQREVVECGVAFRPIEIWTWEGRPGWPGALPGSVIVYQPKPDAAYKMWLPLDSKRALYQPDMENFLQELYDYGANVNRLRLDLRACKPGKRIDRITGIKALLDYQEDRPLAAEFTRFLEPPTDLAGWSAAAAATVLPELPDRLGTEGLTMSFPKRAGQRLLARARVTLPVSSGIEVATDGEVPELRLVVQGVIERDGEPFDTFRFRFRQTEPSADVPVILVLERALRADRTYLLRLRIQDEVSLREADLSAGFRVPKAPEKVDEPELDGAIQLLPAGKVLGGKDSLLLTPPEQEVMVGLWRTEALVTGERIRKVTFFVDGEAQLTRSRPPFGVEIRLSEVPKEQVVRAEGYDAEGELVAFDEVLVNQIRGAFAVRLVSPKRGFVGSGPVEVRAEVVVPEARRVESVEIRLGDELIATLSSPPWIAQVFVPPPSEGTLTYISATATLDDGRSAEAVRFVNAPDFVEEVEVNLVELYAAVLDRSGRPVSGLQQDDFEVFEDGRRQEISKFEQVANLPLSVGVVIDTSGSMVPSIGQAQQAGKEFIDRVLKPGDRCFVVGFSDRPALLMPPTDDAAACTLGLDELTAFGATALHDAIVSSLYYFRGIRGQKALVLLSDGDDTASSIAFPPAAEYARRSGVAIYTIGLQVGALNVNIRQKLGKLAEETGGRSFFVRNAEELDEVYGEIEEELRSRYLVAYASDNTTVEEGEFREVELKMKRRGLKARTMRGYSP